MAIHCKIKNTNLCPVSKKSGFLLLYRKEAVNKHTVSIENDARDVEDLTKEINLEWSKSFKAMHNSNETEKGAFSYSLVPISATKPSTKTEYIGQRHKYHAKVEMFSLEPILNVPNINLNGGLMACWSDIKEILFPGCSGLSCEIVLRSLETKLKYPLQTKDMRSCSAMERSKFIDCFHCVQQGETIVNLCTVKHYWRSLVEMVARKHRVSMNVTSADCCCEKPDIDKSLDITCNVEYSVRSHYYYNADCSVEILSMQQSDLIVHPLPGFIMTDQGGQKEMYVPLVTLLSIYPGLSSWLRGLLGQLAEKCVLSLGSKLWLNKPILVFCSKRQGLIVSHLMSKYGYSGPYITTRTMLVKWSYLTKSYFAGKILTDYLEQNDNYSENFSVSSLPKSSNFGRGGQETSEAKEIESPLPLRPIQNYQEQLWDYQKLKHQYCKQVTYRVVFTDGFQALGPKSKSRTEVMNNPTESKKLTLRKKWLSSLGKYDNKEIIPMQRTGLECWAISDKIWTERKKIKVCRLDSEKENVATRLSASNPSILNSGQENVNFKDPTSNKRYMQYKEKILSFHPCYKDKDKPLDSLDRSSPGLQRIQNVHSSNSQSQDITVDEGRQSSSQNTPKIDFEKILEKRRIRKDGSSYQRRSFYLKEEQNRGEHDSDQTPCKTLNKHVKRGQANFLIGEEFFRGQEKDSSSGVAQERGISKLNMSCGRPLNKETKNGNEVNNPSSRHSSHADCKEVEVIQLVTLNRDVNYKKTNKNNIENKNDDEMEKLSVDLANSFAKIATTTTTTNNNNNSCNNNLNKNNNADDSSAASKNDIAKAKDNNISKKLLADTISTNTQKSKTIKEIQENSKDNDCDSYGNKKQTKSYREKMFKTVPEVSYSLNCQPQNSNILSKTKTSSSLGGDESVQEKQGTLQRSHSLKDITTAHKQLTGAQTSNNKEDASQEKSNLKVDSKSSQLGARRNSKSTQDAVTIQTFTSQYRYKKKLVSFEDDSRESPMPEIAKLWPLKKNILMRESNRQELEVLKENQKLDCSCQHQNPPLQFYTLQLYSSQKNFNKKYKEYYKDCPTLLIPPEQVKHKDSNQAYKSTNDTESHTTVSHRNQWSPLVSASALTLSSSSSTSVKRGTSPRHPKKILLDNFHREEKEAAVAATQEETLVTLEESKQEILHDDISKERLDFILQIQETVDQKVVPATNSQSMTNEPTKAWMSDDGVRDRNKRLENISSQLSDQRNQMTDSCPQKLSAHGESDSDFPFAFRLECIYDINYQRVGYIHRKIPAISIPYILIGAVEFVTVRSAMKLFFNFDEKCFVKSFLRNDKQATCQARCSRDQALLLRKINTLPDLKPTEGEALIPIGSLIYNFHRFKEAMRRLRNHNKQTSQSHNSTGQRS